MLRDARRRSGLTLRALAERAETSHSTLSSYEMSTVLPRADTMLRVLEAAGWRVAVIPASDLDLATRTERGRQLEELLRFTAHFPTARTGPLPNRRFGKVA
jgi:transcriptional regulator with XRE-family HTH domain